MSRSPNDNHWHALEEKRHQRHAEIRAAAIRGDGSVERGEAELSAIRYRREMKRLQDALRNAQDQIREVRS